MNIQRFARQLQIWSLSLGLNTTICDQEQCKMRRSHLQAQERETRLCHCQQSHPPTTNNLPVSKPLADDILSLKACDNC
jgi:hypothetical protein